MSREQVFSEVKELVKPYVKNMDAFNSATEETTFLKDLQINSARLVDIILDMETKFDITVSDEEADQVRTLGSAVDLLVQKKSDWLILIAWKGVGRKFSTHFYFENDWKWHYRFDRSD